MECIVKRLILRASSLLKGFVLALIFSVFLQASLASANGAIELYQGNFYSTIDADISGEDGSIGGNYKLIESIYISIANGGGPPQSGSTIFGTFTGTLDGDGFTISGLTLPLFDVIGVADDLLTEDFDETITAGIENLILASAAGVSGNGALAHTLNLGSTIDNVSSSANVMGLFIDTNGEFVGVGGLVGTSYGTITNSDVTGTVDGDLGVGGLVGISLGDISNSYATGGVTGDITNSDAVYTGGLVGISLGDISNSYATGEVVGIELVGGLVGASLGDISNSYATGEVVGIYLVGGLVGGTVGNISNSYAAGTVGGTNDVGGLVGALGYDGDPSNSSISNSYATGDVDGTSNAGGLVGSIDQGTFSNSYGTGAVNGYGYEGPEPEILSIVNTSLGDDFVPAFEVDALINGGRPYLISLIDSYDVVEEDTEETPSFSLRSYYTQAAKSLDKALAHFGFKSNFSSHPDLDFQALEQNQSKLPAVIQLFEVSEYQNSNILLSKEDGLQLSISSYYKESVEIWTQGLDGEYLYLGLVEFDKDGKAILPALKFDTANTHQLLMIKAADKLNEKPNLEAKVGQININVF